MTDVKNLFPLDKFDAFLFDCDGTIADSMPVHLVAWNQALSPWGASLSLEQHLNWAGRPTSTIVGLLNEQLGLSMPAKAVTHDKEAAYMKLIQTVEPVQVIKSTIDAYFGKLPFAVVSGSPRDSVIKTLTHLGVIHRFPVILGAEDYALGKPAPDCFLNAARLLNVRPERCLVFEDADLGVQAARTAAMGWVRVGSNGFLLKESQF